MYKCPKHGILDFEWCEPCNKVFDCDHSTKTKVPIRAILDCEDGEFTPTFIVTHCATCGEIFDVMEK